MELIGKGSLPLFSRETILGFGPQTNDRISTVHGTESPSCFSPQAINRSFSSLGTNSSSMWAIKQIFPMVLHLDPQ